VKAAITTLKEINKVSYRVGALAQIWVNGEEEQGKLETGMRYSENIRNATTAGRSRYEPRGCRCTVPKMLRPWLSGVSQ
jgi:hypothetical protein